MGWRPCPPQGHIQDALGPEDRQLLSPEPGTPDGVPLCPRSGPWCKVGKAAAPSRPVNGLRKSGQSRGPNVHPERRQLMECHQDRLRYPEGDATSPQGCSLEPSSGPPRLCDGQVVQLRGPWEAAPHHKSRRALASPAGAPWSCPQPCSRPSVLCALQPWAARLTPPGPGRGSGAELWAWHRRVSGLRGQ